MLWPPVKSERVLVIEDDAPTRAMVAAVLTRSEFLVDACASSREAVQRFELSEYEVIVLSLASRDPESDREMLEQLKRRSDKSCVIALSAGSQAYLDGFTSDLIAARLRKPFHIADLVDAVRRCVSDQGAASHRA